MPNHRRDCFIDIAIEKPDTEHLLSGHRMNIQHSTSNIQHRILKLQYRRIASGSWNFAAGTAAFTAVAARVSRAVEKSGKMAAHAIGRRQENNHAHAR